LRFSRSTQSFFRLQLLRGICRVGQLATHSVFFRAPGPIDPPKGIGWAPGVVIDIRLNNGEGYNLSPQGGANQYKDQKGRRVNRIASAGDMQQFKWAHRNITVNFNRDSHGGGDYGQGNRYRSVAIQMRPGPSRRPRLRIHKGLCLGWCSTVSGRVPVLRIRGLSNRSRSHDPIRNRHRPESRRYGCNVNTIFCLKPLQCLIDRAA